MNLLIGNFFLNKILENNLVSLYVMSLLDFLATLVMSMTALSTATIMTGSLVCRGYLQEAEQLRSLEALILEETALDRAFKFRI